MKNLLKYFVPMTAAVVAFAACNQETVDVNDSANVPALQITVTAHPDEIQGEVDTKTYIDGTTIKWGTGEYMKIGVYDGTATTFGNSTDDTADAWDGDTEAYFNFSITPANASGEYTYYGLYPASAAVASANTTPASYKVNLPSTQNATAASYDPKAYILVARADGGHDAANADWTAAFRRATALNHITLKNLSEDIKRVTITAPSGVYLAGARHIDLTTGASGDIYSGGGRTETVDVRYASKLSGGANMDIWFTSWDAEIPVGQHLVIVAYSDTHTFTRDLTVVNKSITFKEGYLNTLSVNMSSAIQGDNTEIDEGDYLVLAKDGENYYALKAEKEDGKERLLSVAYTGSRVSYYGDADLIWSLTKSGDSFIFENSSKYLGYKGSSNESYWLEADENWTEDNYLLDVTAQGGASDPYHVTLHSNASRYLSKNSSADFFAFYGNTGQKADIVFVPATVDNRTVATLSFAEDAIALTTANYDSFLGQNVTASPNVTAITEHLNWSKVDNNSVIDEFNAGVLTLTGNEGSATVTVSFDGDANYRPAEASYTITVSAASGPQYELVSTANGVVAGDYIITWDNTYYLVSGSTSGTNPAVGTGITVANNKITNTVTSDMVWTFTGDNTNGFTISDGTNILHSTNTAQGISINTTSTRKWTASVDNTYGMLLHGDDGGTRNLAVYNNATWRYYATGASYSGILRLYKLADNRDDASLAWKKNSVAADSDTASLETGDDTLPTIALDNSAHSHPVTYSSSNTDVATIVESGVGAGTITLVAAGETTISAIFAGDEDYKPLTVSYTLTVSDNRTKVATPTFSPAAGEVEANQVVNISCGTAGATIYYTTDGSTPTTSSTQGTSVTIDAAKTIKAIAVKADYKDSDVAEAAYTLAGVSSTISQVLAGGAGSYTINNILVYSVVGNQAIVGDNTGKMVLYKSGHGLAAGDNISIPTATVAEYNGILQIQDGTFNKNSTGNSVDHGSATDLNNSATATSTLAAFSAAGYHAATYVTMNGTQSGRNINGTNASLYLSAANATYDGQAVTVTGYIYYYNSSHTNYNFQVVSIAPDESTPTISVTPTSLSWADDATDNKTLSVTLNGAANAGDYSYEVTSGTAGDWNISDNNAGTITVSPKAANQSTENAKSITLRIKHADAPSTVYQDVTCTQAKASGGGGTEYTSTLTFTAKCNGSGTADDDASWTVTSDGTESNFDNTKGIHYGTSSAQVQYIRLTTSDIPGTISRVVVNASTASNVSATVSVTVGGSAFGGAAQSLTTSAANYTFDGSASGEIVVTVTKPSKATKAIYVKSIVVTYTN